MFHISVCGNALLLTVHILKAGSSASADTKRRDVLLVSKCMIKEILSFYVAVGISALLEMLAEQSPFPQNTVSVHSSLPAMI